MGLKKIQGVTNETLQFTTIYLCKMCKLLLFFEVGENRIEYIIASQNEGTTKDYKNM